MSSRLQNLIVIVGLVLISFLGYYLYTQNKASSLDSSNESINTKAALESADFLRKLNELKSLSLDDSILTDPKFQSFVDNRTPLIQKEIGRDNPFLEAKLR